MARPLNRWSVFALIASAAGFSISYALHPTRGPARRDRARRGFTAAMNRTGTAVGGAYHRLADMAATSGGAVASGTRRLAERMRPGHAEVSDPLDELEYYAEPSNVVRFDRSRNPAVGITIGATVLLGALGGILAAWSFRRRTVRESDSESSVA